MKTVLIAATAALLAFGASAYAQTSHIFGNGGTTYQFDAQCHRVTFVPPGISDHEAINVVGQQVYCLVRRPDPFARCVKHLGAAPLVVKGHTHPDGTSDWKGVSALRNYLAKVAACSKARLA